MSAAKEGEAAASAGQGHAGPAHGSTKPSAAHMWSSGLFVGMGLLGIVVAAVAADAVVARLAAIQGAAAFALGVLGLLGARCRTVYAVLLALLTLLCAWASLIAWSSADMADERFEAWAKRDWGAYFAALQPEAGEYAAAGGEETARCAEEYSAPCWCALTFRRASPPL